MAALRSGRPVGSLASCLHFPAVSWWNSAFGVPFVKTWLKYRVPVHQTAFVARDQLRNGHYRRVLSLSTRRGLRGFETREVVTFCECAIRFNVWEPTVLIGHF